MPGERTLEPFLYRNDTDPVALGDIAVRQFLFMMEKDLVQFLTDGLLCKLPLAAKVPKGRGGVVQYSILPDGTFDIILQTGQVRKFCVPGSDAGAPSLRVLQVPAKPLDGGTEPGN